MSNTINTSNTVSAQILGNQMSANQGTGQAPVAAPDVTDAQIVSKVASIQIKPSNVDEVAQPLKATVEQAAQDMQNYVKTAGRNLSFSVDQNSGHQVVRVVNSDTGELIRQMPSPEFLKLAESMPQTNSGFDNQRA